MKKAQESPKKKRNPYTLVWYKQGWSKQKTKDNNTNYWQWEADNSDLKEYKCTDCQKVSMKKDNGEIRVGFCDNCEHPLWNDKKLK